MIFQNKFRKSGFTLIEIVIVVVILGILAAVALPKITGHNEQVIKSEGMQILIAVLNAQRAYLVEKGVYSSDFSNLDITFPTSSYFDDPAALDPGGLTGIVANVARKTGLFTLSIDDGGVITCDDATAGADCANIGCAKNGVQQCN